jgi:hypothetical protein
LDSLPGSCIGRIQRSASLARLDTAAPLDNARWNCPALRLDGTRNIALACMKMNLSSIVSSY